MGLCTPSPLDLGPRVDSIGRARRDVLLLGCGGVGSVIARHLSTDDGIESLVLADIDAALAKRTAEALRTEKTRPIILDASDSDAVAGALQGIRLVVNATLPRFNRGIQAAALKAGADYLDLSNDTRDPLRDSKRWHDVGLTSLHGMGEDPGLSNVLARYAADALDEVESIKIRDGDTASSPGHPFVSLFSPETFLEETLSASRIWKDGVYVDVPPFGEPEVYDFPEPVGPLAVYSVDHEETDTLPRLIGKGVRYVDFKLALDDPTIRTLKLFRDLHLLDAGAPQGRSARNAVLANIPKPADLAGKVDGHAALVVEVAGSRDAIRVVRTLRVTMSHQEAFERFGTTATSYITGTGAAVGAIALATDRIHQTGSLSPEQLDPNVLLPLLRERGIEVRERVRSERRLN